ncbi:MAG: hypothetical protein WCE75_08240 [Terracidiphilus sp.]|jgi:flagellar basal body rod protein FlgG
MADFSIPIQGMAQASADLNQAAYNIARSSAPARETDLPQDTVELSTSVVNLLQAKNDFAANSKTVHVMDQMNKALLDMIG